MAHSESGERTAAATALTARRVSPRRCDAVHDERRGTRLRVAFREQVKLLRAGLAVRADGDVERLVRKKDFYEGRVTSAFRVRRAHARVSEKREQRAGGAIEGVKTKPFRVSRDAKFAMQTLLLSLAKTFMKRQALPLFALDRATRGRASWNGRSTAGEPHTVHARPGTVAEGAARATVVVSPPSPPSPSTTTTSRRGRRPAPPIRVLCASEGDAVSAPVVSVVSVTSTAFVSSGARRFVPTPLLLLGLLAGVSAAAVVLARSASARARFCSIRARCSSVSPIVPLFTPHRQRAVSFAAVTRPPSSTRISRTSLRN